MAGTDTLPGSPVEGKTYSLYGNSDSSSDYYHLISELADALSVKWGSAEKLLDATRQFSQGKKWLKRISKGSDDESLICFTINLLNESLQTYTQKTEDHLKELSWLRKFRDRTIATTRAQYHLYMLEIELTNRLNAAAFLQASRKLALLPHCIRDFTTTCKAEPDEIDYRCRHCSKKCYENHVSLLLEKYGIVPYIWMSANIRKTFKKAGLNLKSSGILGIACIPELVAGMRKCSKYGIPVVGIPLDANRCIRWMGAFHENSVNLSMLEKLISKEIAR